MNKRRAFVLFSGGQDSTTCLAWALERFAHVETVGFDYGQRHRVELDCRRVILDKFRVNFPHWANRLGDDHVLSVGVLTTMGETALTSDAEITFQEDGLPNTFVPGRNLLFLTLAAALAYRRSIEVIVGGMCETDYSGYPDCRDNTIKAMQVALALGVDRRLVLETPLMWMDKADTWRLACDMGGEDFVELIRSQTHTCYLGERSVLHEWGYGCNKCPACELRSTGYTEWRKRTVGAPSFGGLAKDKDNLENNI
ncbi:7-cyano-7-deazaguanine synthase QueC [Burkholderia sp. GbtcB21]|uniref:7-cyano-7-deazaguanine synthase QueC n=1 Tax=Burkholderia sp. GbtcB21 TaxID=2824766 RepID=UPI001C2F4748